MIAHRFSKQGVHTAHTWRGTGECTRDIFLRLVETFGFQALHAVEAVFGGDMAQVRAEPKRALAAEAEAVEGVALGWSNAGGDLLSRKGRVSDLRSQIGPTLQRELSAWAALAQNWIVESQGSWNLAAPLGDCMDCT